MLTWSSFLVVLFYYHTNVNPCDILLYIIYKVEKENFKTYSWLPRGLNIISKIVRECNAAMPAYKFDGAKMVDEK